MKPDIKKRWVDALRSGKYKQGQGSLETLDGEHCCLGVLCAIAAEEGIVERAFSFDDGLPEYAGNTAWLPDPVKEWAGITSNNPHVGIGRYEVSTLGELNDKGESFDYIAQLIEEQL